jgi:hypothetical protein
MCGGSEAPTQQAHKDKDVARALMHHFVLRGCSTRSVFKPTRVPRVFKTPEEDLGTSLWALQRPEAARGRARRGGDEWARARHSCVLIMPRRRLLPVAQLGAIEVLVLYCSWGLDAARPMDACIQGCMSRHAFRNDGMPPLWPHRHGPAREPAAALGRVITSHLGVCCLVLRGGSAEARILKSALYSGFI